MISLTSFITLILMAVTTYLTRIIGFLLIRNRNISPKMKYTMECTPGCVLISVIAPQFVSSEPATLIGLIITILAATRFSLLVTVCVSILSTGFLRHFLN
ncbi:AzlD family protein [Acinetobacter sp. 105-3]|uniref:AzlD family protein n=1 Tax=Acinetobacter sp. 105-3 TaxID=2686015 RepID=UPI0019588A8B|nr:AzlD family protein [Acinetobacter sp. 105-3]MBM7142292.1 AzlD family protein [Acinetobacter sp. 105-3]